MEIDNIDERIKNEIIESAKLLKELKLRDLQHLLDLFAMTKLAITSNELSGFVDYCKQFEPSPETQPIREETLQSINKLIRKKQTHLTLLRLHIAKLLDSEDTNDQALGNALDTVLEYHVDGTKFNILRNIEESEIES